MKRVMTLCVLVLTLTMALCPAALAADLGSAATAAQVCYPTSISRSEDGTELKKIYDLGPEDVILFQISGAWYFMADIGLRMLTPRELYRANGFPDDYKIERDYTGQTYGKSKQVARCGNAVPPPFATALVRANLPEWCAGVEINTMEELERAVAV